MMNLCRTSAVILSIACLDPSALWAQSTESAGGARGMRGGAANIAERRNMPAPQGFSVVLVLGEMQGVGAADSVPSAARKALADMKDFLPYKGYRLLDTQWTLCCGRSAVISRLRGPDEQDYDLELSPTPTETSGKWYVRFALRDPSAGGDDETANRLSLLNAQRAELQQQLVALRERDNESHPEVQRMRERLAALERAVAQARSEPVNRSEHTPAALQRRVIIDTSFSMDIGETVVVGTSRLKGDKALIALLTAVPSTRPPSR
jgi:hypothetical protein